MVMERDFTLDGEHTIQYTDECYRTVCFKPT